MIITYALYKVWDLQAAVPTNEMTIPATGKVEHIEVVEDVILWSVDEPVDKDVPEVTVGVVYMMDTKTMSSVPLKVSTATRVCIMHPFEGMSPLIQTAV